MTTTISIQDLAENDLEHLIHPLYHRKAQENQTIFERGEGVWLTDVNGKRYIDGLSCLWNVNVGHGRAELAEAAAEQMRTLAFVNSYTGFSNIPAIELATKLASLAPGDLNSVFFTSGGGESTESAFKMARYLWNVQGQPEKYKIISRMDAYHGVTLAALGATGIPQYWDRFGPPAPGFFHALAPNIYRLGDGDPERTAQEAIDSIEEIVAREGANTVAAVIAEPVQGAGGVIVPPPQYIRMLRELCDQHNMLLIADEIITGFGRTGRWFAQDHYGVQADIMAFAKGVTSGYVQLGGIIVSKRIQELLAAQPPDVRWMHAYTYSAHPTACAVGLANIAIIEREGLVEHSAQMGRYLLEQLETLRSLRYVGDVRGLGLLARVELVKDTATKESFAPADHVGDRVMSEARKRGLISRNRGEVICIAPPLVIEKDEIDQLVTILRESIEAITSSL
ncbi:MAG TPA: aspartate aminotransferase family protein [Dehalococcoidia bacterium]|nr:aspartate aminotransferase family protein [Dehalococcoidia bacterium]